VLEEASLTELERRQVPKLMPGPTIEARFGEEIVIRLRNSLREPTVVHWHGLRIPAEMAACRAGRDIRVSACPA
jgi:FtsP/CotA-like multicopper oxidase with cupredoxin domain